MIFFKKIILFYVNGIKRLSDSALVALTILIAESKPEEKEIIVDYAHHPTEIKNSYLFMSKSHKKINLIFQPHTYSRTKNFIKEFVSVLSKFDKVFIFKTYSARENESDGMSAFELCKQIKKINKSAEYIDDENDVKQKIKEQKDDEKRKLLNLN